MPAEPSVVERADQPYVAVKGRVTMHTFAAIADRLLLSWADEHGLEWDVADTRAGQRWGCRLEVLKTNPNDEPDMSKWETDLVFKLADQRSEASVR
jgi:protein subunit release factor B